MFTKNGIYTLVDVVIVELKQVDLLPQSCTTQKFVAFDATQAKERSYYDQHPINEFLPLAIETFGCLHKHVDVFLHDYANVNWIFKKQKDLIFFVLVTFFIKKIQLHCKGCRHPPS